jgi:hypothetical protein
MPADRRVDLLSARIYPVIADKDIEEKRACVLFGVQL